MMKGSDPMLTVSVIIPTKDRPERLIKALHSVLEQTHTVDEIIVVDDGGEFSLRSIEPGLLENICMVRNEVSKGGGAARNKGVSVSNSDILMFLDDDDEWEPAKVETQLRLFIDNPDVGLVYSSRQVVSEDGRYMYIVRATESGNLFPKILWNNVVGVTSAVALRKDVFEKAGGFDELLLARQDYDLWIRCVQLTRVAAEPTSNVRYTLALTPGTQISGQYERHAASVYRIMEKYRADIAALGWLRRRQVRWSHYFYVAKSAKRQGWKVTLPWVLKCFVEYPHLKPLLLLLPSRIISRVRRSTGEGL